MEGSGSTGKFRRFLEGVAVGFRRIGGFRSLEVPALIWKVPALIWKVSKNLNCFFGFERSERFWKVPEWSGSSESFRRYLESWNSDATYATSLLMQVVILTCANLAAKYWNGTWAQRCPVLLKRRNEWYIGIHLKRWAISFHFHQFLDELLVSRRIHVVLVLFFVPYCSHMIETRAY